MLRRNQKRRRKSKSPKRTRKKTNNNNNKSQPRFSELINNLCFTGNLCRLQSRQRRRHSALHRLNRLRLPPNCTMCYWLPILTKMQPTNQPITYSDDTADNAGETNTLKSVQRSLWRASVCGIWTSSTGIVGLIV